MGQIRGSGVKKLVNPIPNYDAMETFAGDSVRRLRKSSGTSQIDLAKILGIHQSAISRIENGEQEISVSQLLIVSRYFGVDASAILTGRINYWGVAERFKMETPIGERYRTQMYSKVRELTPLIAFMNLTKGEKFTLETFNRFNLESLLFANGDQPISTHCLFDILRYLLANKVIDSNNLSQLTQCALDEKYHEALFPIYRGQSSPLRLIQNFVVNTPYYGDEYQFDITELTPQTMSVTRKRKESLNPVLTKEPKLDEFLCEYRCRVIQNLPRILNQGSADVKIDHQAVNEGHEECLLKIRC